MIFGSKSLAIFDLLARLIAPCVVAYLNSSTAPAITGMDPGKKLAIVSLLTALNAKDDKVKAALKHGEAEVLKIQGGD
jgi:hypothetical protein